MANPATEGDSSSYILHSDDEITRLTLQHHIITHVMNNQLVLAPIDFSAPLTILDSCTADGIWLRDLQTTIGPHHTFIGTDIQPSYFPTNPASNTSYHAQDATKPWPAEWAQNFDLVHQRFAIAVAGSEPDTKLLVQRLVEMVKPGGWIQIIDLQEWKSDADGRAWQDYFTCLSDMIKVVGSSLQRVDSVRDWFGELGLVGVKEKVIEMNFGTRVDKEMEAIGRRSALLTARQVLEVVQTLPQEVLTLPKERVSELIGALEEEFASEYTKAHLRYKAVWARKPE